MFGCSAGSVLPARCVACASWGRKRRRRLIFGRHLRLRNKSKENRIMVLYVCGDTPLGSTFSKFITRNRFRSQFPHNECREEDGSDETGLKAFCCSNDVNCGTLGGGLILLLLLLIPFLHPPPSPLQTSCLSFLLALLPSFLLPACCTTCCSTQLQRPWHRMQYSRFG